MDTAILYHQNQQLCHSLQSSCSHLVHTHSIHSRPVFSLSSSANVRKQIQNSSELISAVVSIDVIAVEASEVEDEGISLLVDFCFFDAGWNLLFCLLLDLVSLSAVFSAAFLAFSSAFFLAVSCLVFLSCHLSLFLFFLLLPLFLIPLLKYSSTQLSSKYSGTWDTFSSWTSLCCLWRSQGNNLY